VILIYDSVPDDCVSEHEVSCQFTYLCQAENMTHSGLSVIESTQVCDNTSLSPTLMH